MGTTIRVLHVDDDEAFGETLEQRLGNAADRISVLTVTDARSGLYRLSDMEIDCVVSDYSMPGLDGGAFYEAVREEHPDLPFIFFTHSDSESLEQSVLEDPHTTHLEKDLDTVEALADRIQSAIEVQETEEARRASEERYRRLLETAPGPIFIYSNDGEMQYVNEAGRSFLGADNRETLIGTDAREFVHPDSRELVDDRYERLVDKREAVEPVEQRIVTVDGDEKHVIMASAPITYDGEPAIQTVGTDITAQKERERELQRYRTITETLPDIVYTLDMDGRVTSINADTLRTGHTREELIGEHVSTIVDDADVQIGDEKISALVDDPEQSKATFEMDLLTKNGERIPMESHITLLPPDEDGQIQGSIGVLRDISDRKERERQLEYERDRFAALFSNLPNPSVYGVHKDGQPVVKEVNEAFEEVFGYEADSIVGEPLDELIVPEGHESEAETLNEEALDGYDLRREVTRQAVDGERDFLLHLTLEEVDDRLEGYAIYTDITDQKEREAVLARQNDRLDRFASILSHDLRTPMTVARGRAELLDNEIDNDHVDDIMTSLERMEQLITDVRTMVKEGEPVGEAEPVSLSETVQSCVPSPEIEVKIERDLEFEGDPGRVQQLLENLFRNVLDHAGSGATVWVGPLSDANGFFIEDNGPGIPPEQHGNVFRPGYSTDESGTGLGLSIVREIVEAHDWEIAVSEGPAGGARFEVSGVETLDDEGLTAR